jgi:hypothetical protein
MCCSERSTKTKNKPSNTPTRDRINKFSRRICSILLPLLFSKYGAMRRAVMINRNTITTIMITHMK